MSASDPGVAFTAPWQAQVFALVDSLRNHEVLGADEWSRALGEQLARLPPDSCDAEAIWGCWVAALETCLVRRGIAASLQLTSLRQSWAIAAEKTPHGDAIELGPAAYRLAGLTRPSGPDQVRSASATSRTSAGPR